MEYKSKMSGAEYLAYPPVVGGGDRATIIHYIDNNQIIYNGEMVLMDAGCEYHGYSSDITRTWPINGRYSPEQKILYEIILSVQEQLINELHKFPSLDQLFTIMCFLLGVRLKDIGLIQNTESKENLIKAAFQFCPHNVSHYLGMDVHDTPRIPKNIPIKPGMIITMEPGIYLTNKHNVPKEFQGIGIRIEDDVLITENGPIVLSRKCPKSLQNIEDIISNRH